VRWKARRIDKDDLNANREGQAIAGTRAPSILALDRDPWDRPSITVTDSWRAAFGHSIRALSRPLCLLAGALPSHPRPQRIRFVCHLAAKGVAKLLAIVYKSVGTSTVGPPDAAVRFPSWPRNFPARPCTRGASRFASRAQVASSSSKRRCPDAWFGPGRRRDRIAGVTTQQTTRVREISSPRKPRMAF
jgi:hypothetical protein